MPFNMNKGTFSRFSAKKKDEKKPMMRGALANQETDKSNAKKKEKQKEEIDADAENEEIQEDHDRDLSNDEREEETAPVVKKTKNVRVKSTVEREPAPADEESFAAFHHQLLGYKLIPVEFQDTSYYIPNSIPLFRILDIAGRLVGQTKWMREQEFDYCEYKVACGLAVAYYLQILRARQAAQVSTGYENSALGAFEKHFGLEGITIPEPFYPYFSQLIAHEVTDSKYDWIVPQLPSLTGLTSFEAFCSSTNTNWQLAPNVPFMLSILTTLATEDLATIDQRIDGDQYTIVDMDAHATNTVQLFHQTLRRRAATAAGDSFNGFLHAGVTFPVRFHNDNVNEAVKKLKRSKLIGADRISTAATNGRVKGAYTLLETTDVARIDKFLYCSKDRDLSWFEPLAEELKLFASFFNKKYNLSQVPKTGGQEPAVECMLRVNTRHTIATAQEYRYPGIRLGLTNEGDFEWYMDRYDTMTASFRSTRANMDRKEELNALTFGINADLPIHTKTASHGGDFFEDNTRDRYQLTLGPEEYTQKGLVPMYRNYEGIVKRMLRKSKKPDFA